MTVQINLHRRMTAFAIAVIVAACVDVFSPEMVPAAERFEPPDDYKTWWAEMEACSGRHSPFSRVRWYQVPNKGFFLVRREEYSGYWWPSHDVVIAGYWITEASVVRHEMLHDLLITGAHPPLYFEDRCAARRRS